MSVKFGQLGADCGTASKGTFNGGDTLVWTRDDLGSCQESGYDLNLKEADVTIGTSSPEDKFCPGRLSITLEHGGLYEADFFNVGGISTSTMMAKKKSGEIA